MKKLQELGNPFYQGIEIEENVMSGNIEIELIDDDDLTENLTGEEAFSLRMAIFKIGMLYLKKNPKFKAVDDLRFSMSAPPDEDTRKFKMLRQYAKDKAEIMKKTAAAIRLQIPSDNTMPKDPMPADSNEADDDDDNFTCD